MATRFENGEQYLDGPEARSVLGISKQTFYTKIKLRLQVYKFDGKEKPWYLSKQVEALRTNTPLRKANLVIPGILRDWASYARDRGFDAESIDREATKIVSLPEEIAQFSGLPAGDEYAMRSRMGLLNSDPFCQWVTYYPLNLVRGEVLESMLRDSHTDTVGMIAKKLGKHIVHADERVTSRLPSIDEQSSLRIKYDEPLLIVERVCRAEDGTVVLIHSQALLASHFFMEYHYSINWKA